MTNAANSDLVAGGSFTWMGSTAANRIARWNGSTWSPLGSGVDLPLVLTTLPNGDIVVGGFFTTAGGVPANSIARWNGASWSPLGSGVDGLVEALTMHPSGQLVAGGAFFTAGGLVSPFLARLTTTCPATATASGSGCPSSGGSNTLVANTLPWVDATFRATGTGLPTTAIVVTLTSVTSIAQGVAPLTLAFPQAGAGCDVLVAPDILGALVTTNGTVQSSLFLPNTPPLVGVTFYHQMVPIELDGFGNWIAVTATNALQLTAGLY